MISDFIQNTSKSKNTRKKKKVKVLGDAEIK